MKKFVALVLASVLLLGLLCGCESTQEKMQALSGTWYKVVEDTEEQARALLDNIDLYEEEIALVDLTSLSYVKIVEFDMENNYRFAYDVEGCKEYVRTFYVGCFDSIFEGRAVLNEAYSDFGLDFSAMSKEELQQFYADLYEYADFNALIDAFVDNAYDYESLAEDIETGTYTIRGNKINCTVTGETEEEYMIYSIENDVLTLTYADDVEVYTRNK